MLKQPLREQERFIKTFFKKLILLEYDIKKGNLPAEYFRLAVKKIVLESSSLIKTM
jgi:hypothetical protein